MILCGDVLTLAPVRGVRVMCVLEVDEKGAHDGYCRSKDGRSWETGRGDHAPHTTHGEGTPAATSSEHDLLAVLADRSDSLPDWARELLAPYRRPHKVRTL